MGRLDPEARMTIKTLAARGATNSHIARLLGVTEGAVRHHLARMQAGALDGRSRQEPKAACVAAAIDHWRQMQEEGPINLAVLHAWLVSEHGYSGSLRSIQRYWARTYPAPALRARRRVETPPGAQAQVDWAHFPAIVVGGLAQDLVALHMVLSWSRKAAIVWSETKDMLAWVPDRLLYAARRRAGDGAHRQREDRDGARCGRVGDRQSDLPTLRDGSAFPC